MSFDTHESAKELFLDAKL